MDKPFLEERTFQVCINKSKSRVIKAGIPQGGWKIFSNPVDKKNASNFFKYFKSKRLNEEITLAEIKEAF